MVIGAIGDSMLHVEKVFNSDTGCHFGFSIFDVLTYVACIIRLRNFLLCQDRKVEYN